MSFGRRPEVLGIWIGGRRFETVDNRPTIRCKTVTPATQPHDGDWVAEYNERGRSNDQRRNEPDTNARCSPIATLARGSLRCSTGDETVGSDTASRRRGPIQRSFIGRPWTAPQCLQARDLLPLRLSPASTRRNVRASKRAAGGPSQRADPHRRGHCGGARARGPGPVCGDCWGRKTPARSPYWSLPDLKVSRATPRWPSQASGVSVRDGSPTCRSWRPGCSA